MNETCFSFAFWLSLYHLSFWAAHEHSIFAMLPHHFYSPSIVEINIEKIIQLSGNAVAIFIL